MCVLDCYIQNCSQTLLELKFVNNFEQCVSEYRAGPYLQLSIIVNVNIHFLDLFCIDLTNSGNKILQKLHGQSSDFHH